MLFRSPLGERGRFAFKTLPRDFVSGAGFVAEHQRRPLAAALAEDVGTGDLTAQLTPVTTTAQATILCREAAVIAGQPWFDAVFRKLDPDVRITWLVAEGASVKAGTKLCQLAGNARALLTGERTGLNFLQMLSAVATRTRTYVDAIAGVPGSKEIGRAHV